MVQMTAMRAPLPATHSGRRRMRLLQASCSCRGYGACLEKARPTATGWSAPYCRNLHAGSCAPPVREPCSRRVSLESRKGMCAALPSLQGESRRDRGRQGEHWLACKAVGRSRTLLGKLTTACHSSASALRPQQSTAGAPLHPLCSSPELVDHGAQGEQRLVDEAALHALALVHLRLAEGVGGRPGRTDGGPQGGQPAEEKASGHASQQATSTTADHNSRQGTNTRMCNQGTPAHLVGQL